MSCVGEPGIVLSLLRVLALFDSKLIPTAVLARCFCFPVTTLSKAPFSPLAQ